MKMLHLAFILSLILSNSIVVTSQQTSSFTGLTSVTQGTPTNCDLSNNVLNTIAYETGADELIIVIARLGEGERRRALNLRRLHNVRVYLTEYLAVHNASRRPETIILAEGERVSGYGRIEFYIRGRLEAALRLRRNTDLIVGTCVPDDPNQDPCSFARERNFYPCLDRRQRRRERE